MTSLSESATLVSPIVLPESRTGVLLSSNIVTPAAPSVVPTTVVRNPTTVVDSLSVVTSELESAIDVLGSSIVVRAAAASSEVIASPVVNGPTDLGSRVVIYSVAANVTVHNRTQQWPTVVLNCHKPR